MQKVQMNFYCETCDYKTSNKKDYIKHCLTAKHKKCMLLGKNAEKKLMNYHCVTCDFYTSNKTNYKHHELTAKHQKCMLLGKNAEKIQDKTKPESNSSNNDMLMELIKQNNELQKQIIEMLKEPKTVNNTNNNTNNTNIQFNIHQFLNETCKNAPNFSDFIENIQVSENDLENNATMGFVNGMTKLIVDNLKQMELNDRPIHCTDVKRETIYVKEENQWDKEKSRIVIQRGIQEITRKNMCQLTEWREENPEYEDMDSEIGEKSIILQQNLMAGSNRDEFYPKIIKNIAKETILDKKRLLE
jgi:hypothetical protein